MDLEDITCRQSKPRAKPYKLSDGKGMHLLINPTGSKLWRLQYRLAGKQKMLAIGAYPDTSLKAAREKRDDARKLIANGVDPSAKQKLDRQRTKLAHSNTFEAVARRWMKSRAYLWTPDYAGYVDARLTANMFPYIGHRPIAEIEPPELLDHLRKIEAREAFEMANRIRGLCSQVWRFAISEGSAKRDAAADLRGALTVYTSKRHPRVALEDLPTLLIAIAGCEGGEFKRNRMTRIGLQLLSHVALRPGELRKAPWSEIRWADALWHIPGERMKRSRPHLVPLSRQAMALLRELEEFTGAGGLLFPGEGRHGVMSENTLNYALHDLGYKGRHCSHGFRGVMSTVLNEREFNTDWVELQLSHVEENEVRGAYNEAQWLEQRRAMMQWYSDYLDALRGGDFIRPTAFNAPVALVGAAA